MNEDKPIGSEGLVKLIRVRIGQEFDHECHLTDNEARAIISALQSLQRQLEEAREALTWIVGEKRDGGENCWDGTRWRPIRDVARDALAASTLGRVEGDPQ